MNKDYGNLPISSPHSESHKRDALAWKADSWLMGVKLVVN